MTHFERDAMDALVERAMKARGVPAVRGDLALKVLARVRAADELAARLARVGRWMRWCSLAAGLLVAMVLAVGVYVYPGESATTDTTSQSLADDAAETTSSPLDGTVIGLGILGVAVVGVALRGVVLPERTAGRLGWV